MALKKKKDQSNEPEKVADDFLAQEAALEQETGAEYTLDIPDDEIWTYQIEGLQAPHINKPFKNAAIKKVVIVIALVLAIGCAIFLSVRAVHNDMYKYKELEDGTYELVKFSNPGGVTDITVDYVVDLETGEKDETKPISSIAEYAFNCDELITTITIGKDVKSIDCKSIYSCWKLRSVWVDDANETYCDIDGVVYTKDLTHAVHYPTAHDMHLMINNDYAVEEIDDNGNRKFISKVKDDNGNLVDNDGNNLVERVWGTNSQYNELWFQTYNKTCRTYVVPSTVTSLDDMSFAYSDIVDLYLPEGITYMGNMALFKNTALTNIYTYKTDSEITDTTYKAIDSMTEIYPSLPDGLEFIGSDCMYYLRGLNYMYIPSSVTEIGHHALWDAVYKENDELKGVSFIDMGIDEQGYENNVKTGQQWRPQYDYMLFKKSVDLNFSAERQSQFNYNIHRQYYWALQWIIGHSDDTAKAASGYLVKDMDKDGTPELVLREYDAESKTTKDSILTFNHGYLEKYSGSANYAPDDLSAIDDNTMLDTILEG
ncbi:MAG: leucine-rich repeat protein [Eubacterium sp.]|nr:leucine-rich repeat protein [Eubacterium sp.]